MVDNNTLEQTIITFLDEFADITDYQKNFLAENWLRIEEMIEKQGGLCIIPRRHPDKEYTNKVINAWYLMRELYNSLAETKIGDNE